MGGLTSKLTIVDWLSMYMPEGRLMFLVILMVGTPLIVLIFALVCGLIIVASQPASNGWDAHDGFFFMADVISTGGQLGLISDPITPEVGVLLASLFYLLGTVMCGFVLGVVTNHPICDDMIFFLEGKHDEVALDVVMEAEKEAGMTETKAEDIAADAITKTEAPHDEIVPMDGSEKARKAEEQERLKAMEAQMAVIQEKAKQMVEAAELRASSAEKQLLALSSGDAPDQSVDLEVDKRSPGRNAEARVAEVENKLDQAMKRSAKLQDELQEYFAEIQSLRSRLQATEAKLAAETQRHEESVKRADFLAGLVDRGRIPYSAATAPLSAEDGPPRSADTMSLFTRQAQISQAVPPPDVGVSIPQIREAIPSRDGGVQHPQIRKADPSPDAGAGPSQPMTQSMMGGAPKIAAPLRLPDHRGTDPQSALAPPSESRGSLTAPPSNGQSRLPELPDNTRKRMCGFCVDRGDLASPPHAQYFRPQKRGLQQAPTQN